MLGDMNSKLGFQGKPSNCKAFCSGVHTHFCFARRCCQFNQYVEGSQSVRQSGSQADRHFYRVAFHVFPNIRVQMLSLGTFSRETETEQQRMSHPMPQNNNNNKSVVCLLAMRGAKE
eukprot:jgi/Psemu1/27508/gm1.27508_g